MNEIRETCYNQIQDRKSGEISTNERSWINKLTKLADKYPDEVKVIMRPEENYGVLLIDIPKSWFKISPPRKSNMTDEQKAAAAERMRSVRAKKSDE